MLAFGGALMDSSDTILARFHKESRSLYVVLTIVLAIFSVIMLYVQETWTSAFMFAITICFVWSYHWNTGRRIRNGTFGADMSALAQIERADLARWLERNGGTRLPGNLPG